MRRGGPIARGGAALAAAVLLVTGCTKDAAEPDPNAEKTERLTARLEATFSASQASCIVKRLLPTDIDRLDNATALPADGATMTAYDQALRYCVLGLAASTSTTAPATTAAPPVTGDG